MCGFSARTVRSSSARRPARVQAPLLRGDLVRVGRLGLVLLGELERAGRAQVERADDQPAPELGEAARERTEVLAMPRSRAPARSAIGPESSPAVDLDDRRRRSRASPAMIARSIGAAPRQRGSSDGCTFSISQLGQQRLA